MPGGRKQLDLYTFRAEYSLARGAGQERKQERMRREFREEGWRKVTMHVVLQLVLSVVGSF